MSTEPTSLRAYFAAHAPNQPESWFQPAMAHLPFPEKPETPSAVEKAKDEHVEELVLGSLFGGTSAIDPELRALIDAHDQAVAAWEQEVQRIKVEREKYRFLAWRWHYADELINVMHGPEGTAGGVFRL